MANVLNVNIGVLGHVDSGKTSLGSSPSPQTKCQPAVVCSFCDYRVLSSPATISRALLPISQRPRRLAAKTLSTVASTASFDKSAESKERGITLDLGFSSLQLEMPAHLAELPYDTLQFTLVDCPGHASLIRTIIGGAQIIDTMMLVIDITKGW